MKKNKERVDKERIQYAALPFVIKDGQPQVMLITSRETRRWVIPKGWPERKMPPMEVAAREAFEEAGLIGRIAAEPFATFRYEKRLPSGKTAPCLVWTFLFEVQQELDDWPEKGQRERRWMSPGEAALLVSEAGLVEVFLQMAAPMP